MKDPMGKAITEMRDDTAIAAIVQAKVGSEPGETWKPPYIVIAEQGFSLAPFGPGTGRVGLQLVLYAIKCVGPKNETGKIKVRQLVGAVCDVFHNKGGRKGSSVIFRSDVQSGGSELTDPGTGNPYQIVVVAIVAAAQAVA